MDGLSAASAGLAQHVTDEWPDFTSFASVAALKDSSRMPRTSGSASSASHQHIGILNGINGSVFPFARVNEGMRDSSSLCASK
eukprot:CAMPEP_0185263508 /NCGR_PEP_ID=MMETSP1359-20130426/15253_1 /TAXON_ID=552665 /ORGANISM="Bigelowiella longifila, Strain CCMP242" /LENGTH=82 /DNA_ID=CAMNT_0027851089 /DNA_START=408 /DNA_END=653 /DNA_ORIENTATION=+